MIGRAALGVWFDVDAAGLDDVEAWYRQQHLPERLGVPGFLRGRRYRAVAAGRTFFTLYETAGPGVLSSPAYLERLNHPTDWTRRALAGFRGMTRNAYQLVAATPADAPQGHVLTVRIRPESGRGPAVRAWAEAEAVGTVGRLAGVAAGAVYVSDSGGTSVVTEERRIVGQVEAAPPFLVVLEVADAGAEAGLREFWQDWGRRLAAEPTVDLYRLMYGLAWLGPA